MPPKSTQPKNYRTIQQEYKVEIVDFKIVLTKDQQLSNDQSDLLYFELIDFLIVNQVNSLAEYTLSYLKDKNSERYLMTQAKISIQQLKYSESILALDKVLAND